MASVQASVPAPPPPPVVQAAVAASNERASERRFGAKIKVAALVVFAYWILSSQPFFTLLNGVVCSFSLTAAPCITEQGSGNMKGFVLGGGILFIFTMYLLGAL